MALPAINSQDASHTGVLKGRSKALSYSTGVPVPFLPPNLFLLAAQTNSQLGKHSENVYLVNVEHAQK